MMNKQIKCVNFYTDISKLKPVISEIGFDLHYNQIYKQYVDDYNEGEGDIAYNKAGAYLHDLYFDNIREYRNENKPIGRAEHVIDTRYGTYENFLKTLESQVNRLQGSGWVFMNYSGYVNFIPNNRIVDNVAMIIDCWEHAYAFTHGTDRMSYVRQHMSIIDWDKVNERMNRE